MRRSCILFKRTVIAPKRSPRWFHNDKRQFHVSAPSRRAVTDRQTWEDAFGREESFALDMDYENEALDHLKDRDVLKAAVKARASPVMRNLATKYLQDSEPDHELGVSLLEANAKVNLLDVQQATAIYEGLAKDTSLEQLPITVLIYISHLILTSKNAPLELVDKTLAELLRRWSLEDGVGVEGHFPGTWAIFRLIQHLCIEEPSMSISYFRQMIGLRLQWPQNAMKLPTTVNDMSIVMLVFMIRSCIGWRWWERAYSVARVLLGTEEMDSATTTVVHKVLHELVDEHISVMSSNFDPRLPAVVLCSMAQHASLRPVNATLLRRFYETFITMPLMQSEVMSRVYLFLRTLSQGSGAIAYLPPKGTALLTLLSHYNQTNNLYAMRKLLTDTHKYFATKGADRLRSYLSLITRTPFATEAREVYTYCENSFRPDVRLILRSASIAKKLVSLFVSMAEAASQRAIKDPENSKRHLASAEDSMAFAQYVTGKFRQCDTPLAQWDHYKLTSLARLSFEVGFFGMGLRAMKIIANRERTLPDMHDITVVLHTIATRDPHAAFDLVKYMIEKDFEPSEDVYGTIVAQAAKHDDFALIQDIRTLAYERGHVLRDSRVLGALCWHSISPKSVANLSIAEIEMRLRVVLDILGPATGNETVFRERTLGERAVKVALYVGNPRLAYALWKRCLGDHMATFLPSRGPLSDRDIKLRRRILQKFKNREAKGKPVSQSQKDTLSDDIDPKPVPWTKRRGVIEGRSRI